MPTPRILMCPPDYFGIEYEINPWMNVAVDADHALANSQWRGLHDLLVDSGATIELMAPVKGLPDLVFTANAGLIYQDRVLLSRFHHTQRQGETPHDRAWFEAAGFEVVDDPQVSAGAFEGAGDALFCGDTLLAGYRQRSDALFHQAIGALLGVRVLPVELVDARYYHLDTCFCPLAPDEAVWFPAAFDRYGQEAIAAAVPKLISVERGEAQRFACNAVVVGRRVVTNTGCPKLHAELARRGYEPHETPLDEFVKAGGSAKCLTLRLDGEEAAGWRAPPSAAP
ncbi:N(G),N(G)-dimethylarginine dimethylaminohydrolase [Pirellulimonas nuda]|uniref:N(G),N(G)-dimethylarginine dimethylaminohydrolase n=1 Tax=Pirellulimonas nuda TaxID=2528009 RepID=A0A518D827_9BACT|nr:arginine deiminase-related protein [Pirellulimonas nuda]QDU87642.1 N(G),N(G)-dimethylarginine dimethylaminohydrolase [Pirellulimonas nuda]